jgi:hypothetical protein
MGKVMWIWWPDEGDTSQPVVYAEKETWREDGGRWERVVIIPVEDE